MQDIYSYQISNSNASVIGQILEWLIGLEIKLVVYVRKNIHDLIITIRTYQTSLKDFDL